MRAAFHSSLMIGAWSGEFPDAELLRHYLSDGNKQTVQSESVVSPNAAAATMSQMFPGLCK